MAVGRIDHEGVHASIHKGGGTFKGVGSDAHGSGHAQATACVLAGIGARLHLDDVFISDEADEVVVLINHGQLLNFVLLQNVSGFLEGDLRGGDEAFARHHLGDGAVEATLEAQVAVGDDADQDVVAVHHGYAADVVFAHQVEGVFHGGVHMDGDGVANHAVFGAFHFAHLGGLLADGHVFVQHADTPLLRDGDGHAAFGDGVHTGGNHGDVQVDVARELGFQRGFARQYITIRRHEEHVVVRQAFSNKFFVIKIHKAQNLLIGKGTKKI